VEINGRYSKSSGNINEEEKLNNGDYFGGNHMKTKRSILRSFQ